MTTALFMRMFIFILLGAQAGFGLMNQHLFGGEQIIASVTFIAILMAIPIQATTTKWLAKKLDLLVKE